MIKEGTLNNAPIKEALIDIQVAFPDKVSVEALDSGYKEIADRYPKHEVIQRQQFGLHNKGGQPPKFTIDQGIIGYRYTSDDGRRVIQFRMDGFTFSRLEPYDTWEELRDEAAKLWNIYVNAVHPSQIVRVATRYINQLRLPLNARLEEYLMAPPAIPEGLNLTLNSFLTRVEVSDPTIMASGILTQAMEGMQKEFIPVVLDIDVFIVRPFDDPQDAEIWSCLDQLRDFKNDVFRNSLEKKAEELFQ